eukprot:Gregarina_sp_Poly_1__2622@NODE_1713_length_3484_cov_13_206907_g1122_i0_p1_GENE_NODE_1713_length_3484_cov_13_206907_g1122_i0NODE_1713_length_3484_cov_13_206907_g1122_i0_p1_ORF_typecomplete_len389_score34_60DEAD/PF00270_29/2_1e28DEAD/PF00270_29/1_9e03Helicase_C/PF00271_31/2_7e03Helicase_C/PF00271_31/5_3e02Helicase_C/PF00271_31/5_7e25ResIII/PF04851_15/0_00026HAD/PF12710_7/0_18_NODE_1713_length_3484_cov_13_206907_g1122_i011132279
MLPILQSFACDARMFFALVILPTRELAMQVNDQFALFGELAGARCLLITGGADITKQKSSLFDGVHICIGTPGRLKEVLQDSLLRKRFRRVRFAVFDECDRLVISPMKEEMQEIYASLRTANLQVLLFSATIQHLTDEVLKGSFHDISFIKINLSENEKDLNLEHYFCMCPKISRLHLIHYLLSEHQRFKEPSRGMIFVRTIEECETLRFILSKLDHSVVCLHSLQEKNVRLSSMIKFRTERSRILIATDLASRGLDIPLVDWVINMNVPKEYEDYCHRVGRCARSGRFGHALTIVTPILTEKDKHLDVETNRIKNVEAKMKKELLELHIDFFETQKNVHKIAQAQAEAKIRLNEVKFAEKLKSRKDRRTKERQHLKLRIERKSKSVR